MGSLWRSEFMTFVSLIRSELVDTIHNITTTSNTNTNTIHTTILFRLLLVVFVN
jgi:hypothetical protein